MSESRMAKGTYIEQMSKAILKGDGHEESFQIKSIMFLKYKSCTNRLMNLTEIREY